MSREEWIQFVWGGAVAIALILLGISLGSNL
jgi:hypothetical protein